MKHDKRDNGLRKALHSKHSTLPSDFAFSTMQKIEEDIYHREKKTERLMFCYAIIISILLLTGAGFIIIHYYGEEIQRYLSELTERLHQASTSVFPYCHFAVIFFILILFDYLMRLKYNIRHKSKEGLSRQYDK